MEANQPGNGEKANGTSLNEIIVNQLNLFCFYGT